MGVYRKDWEATYVVSPFIDWTDVAPVGSGTHIWKPSYQWGATNLKMEGLSESLPQGAEITEVKFVMNTSAQRQLYVDGAYYAMASKETIKSALDEGKRNLSIHCTWKGEGTSVPQSTKPGNPGPKTTPIGASYVEIIYNGGDGAVTVIRYGIGGEWVDCDAYIGQGGKYVPFEMRYPDNGGWQKIEQRILEE